MDKQAFKQRMQNLKSYRENNPGKGYWDWKVEAFQGGGEIGNEERQYLHSWYTNRREYAKRHMPAMLKQLDDANIYIDPNSRIRNIYSTPITISNPNVRISNPDSSYEDYVNQANEKHAQTWDFRGNNSNLKDDQGNYYIDPNRQLTPEDISNMRSKGAKIPEQWESLEDADISELTNTFAYNMYQDPVQYMANGGEVGDPDDEFI